MAIDFKDLFAKLLTFLKSVRWGWGALYAVYGFAVYSRLLKLFGSAFLGAIVLFLAVCLVASIMRRR